VPAFVPEVLSTCQPNVRALLNECELAASLTFSVKGKGKSASLEAQGRELLTLVRPDEKVFGLEVARVLSKARLREERGTEILSQVVPQTAYWASILGLQPDRHRHTLEWLGAALKFSMVQVMRFKYALGVQRPVLYSALVQPMVLTPGYAAWPSGHATEAYMVAALVGQSARAPSAGVFRPAHRGQAAEWEHQLKRLAFRVAENREVAGLHFPIDTLAGRLLGEVLADYFLACSTGGKFSSGARFRWTHKDRPPAEPCIDEPLAQAGEVDGERPITLGTTQHKVQPLPSLHTLYTWACREWEAV
jgi:hypothetical protein